MHGVGSAPHCDVGIEANVLVAPRPALTCGYYECHPLQVMVHSVVYDHVSHCESFGGEEGDWAG